MNRLFVIVIITVLTLLFFFSCEKDKPESIGVNIDFSESICYPEDKFILIFKLIPFNGQAPYRYKWIHPDTLIGEGPFEIILNSDLILKVDVTDTNGLKISYQHNVIKDTIECSKYDYRNKIIGIYNCNVNSCSVNTDTWIRTCEPHIANLEVIKHQDYSKIQIAGLLLSGSYSSEVDVKIQDIENLYFLNSGERVYAKFYSDSIEVHTQISPAALRSCEYIGKKNPIQN